MVFPSHGSRGATLPGVHPASGDLVSLHSLSYLWVSGRRRRWRLVLASSISPPSTVFPTCGYRGGDAASNLCWRCLQSVMLATPSTSSTGDAFNFLAMPGAVNPLTLPWHWLWLRLWSMPGSSGELKVSPVPSMWHHPYGWWDVPSLGLILTYSELLQDAPVLDGASYPWAFCRHDVFLNVSQWCRDHPPILWHVAQSHGAPIASFGARIAIFRSSKSYACPYHLCAFVASLHRYTQSSFCIPPSWRFTSRIPNAPFFFELPALCSPLVATCLPMFLPLGLAPRTCMHGPRASSLTSAYACFLPGP